MKIGLVLGRGGRSGPGHDLLQGRQVDADVGAAESLDQSRDAGPEDRRSRAELPGDPERDISLVEVSYPPGTGSPPHMHAIGVMAFVVSGTIVSKVGDGPEQTFHAGEAWWEPEGAIHRVSRNASSTESATLLAIYIAPKGAMPADLMKPLGESK